MPASPASIAKLIPTQPRWTLPVTITTQKPALKKNPWSAIDVGHVHTFPKVLALGTLKLQSALAELALVQKGSRLSVMPVTPEQWAAVLGLLR